MKALDKTWDELETLLASRRKTVADMLSTSGGHDDDDPRRSTTEVYKLLSDLYMQTCSVKVRFTCLSFLDNCTKCCIISMCYVQYAVIHNLFKLVYLCQ